MEVKIKLSLNINHNSDNNLPNSQITGKAQPFCRRWAHTWNILMNLTKLNISQIFSGLILCSFKSTDFESFVTIDVSSINFCGHDMAYKYPIVVPQNNCRFIAYKCGNYEDFETGKCGQEYMPLELDFDFYDTNNRVNETNGTNDMYIRTSDRYPYCLFHYQIVVNVINFSQKKVSANMKGMSDLVGNSNFQ